MTASELVPEPGSAAAMAELLRCPVEWVEPAMPSADFVAWTVRPPGLAKVRIQISGMEIAAEPLGCVDLVRLRVKMARETLIANGCREVNGQLTVDAPG